MIGIKHLVVAVSLVLDFSPALANHKIGHPTPPGRALPVCDCLAVEMRQSVFENRGMLLLSPPSRDLVGALTVTGFVHCTEPNSEVDTSGESVLRLVLFMLSGVHPADQEFCRLNRNQKD